MTVPADLMRVDVCEPSKLMTALAGAKPKSLSGYFHAMSLPTLDVILVNWNSRDHLRQCLLGINSVSRDNFEFGSVVIVDNASRDHSVDGIGYVSLPVHLVRNSLNRGFAAACNQGAANVRGDFLLLLNPDARLYPDSISKCIDFLERPENRLIGILGIQLIDDSGEISRHCVRFPTLTTFLLKILGLDRLFPSRFPALHMSDWDHKTSREVDHVIGAFYLMRKKVFRELGGLDERFFVYLEDLDFSLRAHAAGWKIYYLADAKAVHYGGGSSEQIKARRLYYSLQSRILYGYKHFGVFKGSLLFLLTAFVEPTCRILLAAGRFSITEVLDTVLAYALFYSALPRFVRLCSKSGASPAIMSSRSSVA